MKRILGARHGGRQQPELPLLNDSAKRLRRGTERLVLEERDYALVDDELGTSQVVKLRNLCNDLKVVPGKRMDLVQPKGKAEEPTYGQYTKTRCG